MPVHRPLVKVPSPVEEVDESLRLQKKRMRREESTALQLEAEKSFENLLTDKSMGSRGSHPIYILSNSEWGQIRDNCINLSDFGKTRSGGIGGRGNIRMTTYRIESVGKNVHREFERHHKNSPFRLDQVTKKYIGLTVMKDHIKHDSNITLVNEDNSYSSGRALLFLGAMNRKKSHATFCEGKVLDNFHRACRNLVKKTGTFHFGTRGTMFGIGCTPTYSINDNLSVGEFAGSDRSMGEGKTVRDLMGEWVVTGAQILEKVVPRIMRNVTIGNRGISTLFQKRFKNSTKTSSTRNITDGICDDFTNFISTNFCTDAHTKILHTELDCCFTLLFVPPQRKSGRKVHFHIQLDGEKDLYLEMSPQVCLTYSAYLLTHRQSLEINEGVDNNESNGQKFYNVAAYSSQRLFNNSHTSLMRAE